jgi:hypothetical protein
LRKWIRHSKKDSGRSSFGLEEILSEPLTFEGFHKTHRALWAFSALFWAAFLTQAFGGISTRFGLFWAAYFAFSVYALKKIENTFSRLQDILGRMEPLARPFALIERFSRDPSLSENLSEFQNASATMALARLRSGFSYLGIQTHPVLLFALNGLVPWNYFFVSRVEAARLSLNERWPAVFRQLAWFEAMASFALFHRYQSRVFPRVSERLEIRGGRHPLLPLSKNVANDFSWPAEKTLALITGSNMAGKSTFLRMMGVNILLARAGAPVLAEDMTFPVAPLLTCIRVSDSVRDGFSYFYAETKRIGEILKTAREQRSVFLIDEIFKGTNNRERFIGGKAVIGALADSPSQGFVTTHDLDLTSLQNPRLANFHFRDEVGDSDMSFSYKIEAGPCPTTNALKIMALSGLPVP